ncbi:hypothetical protein BS50DRAFT_570342, partial [Corynespora cassiicola Philippines]
MEPAASLGQSIRPATNENWDHLLDRWDKNDDEILDFSVPDEDDGDDEGDDVDDVEEISEEEVMETEVRGKRFTKEEVADVINEAIALFTNKWHTQQQGKEDERLSKALGRWQEVGASGQDKQRELARRIKHNVEILTQRLDLMCGEICEQDWNSEGSIRRQCKVLEGTVEVLEHERWLEQVYDGWLNQVDGNDMPPSDGVQSTQRVEIIDFGSGSDDSEENDQDGNVTCSTSSAPRAAGGATSELTDHQSVEPVINYLEPRRKPQEPAVNLLTPRRNVLLVQSFTSQTSARVSAPVWHGENPKTASIHAVTKWAWADLTRNTDRKRIVMKAIQEIDATDREMLRTRVNTVKKRHLLTEIAKCAAMMVRGESRMRGVLPRDNYKIVVFTKLFLCWWMADNAFKRETPQRRLEELLQCLEDGSTDPGIFYDWVRYVFAHTFSEEALSTPHLPSQAEVIVIDD